MTTWIVDVIKPGTVYRNRPVGYFPRKFYYRRDAVELKKLVETKYGAEATIAKGN